MTATPLDIDIKAFDLIRNPKPVVLVDFWAPWCQPCKQVGKILEEAIKIPEVQENAHICKLDIDGPPSQSKEEKAALDKTVASYGIQGIPTMMLFKDGKLVDTIVGLVSSPEEIKDIILKAAKKGSPEKKKGPKAAPKNS